MKCPKCQGVMESVAFGVDIKVNRCSSCAGLYCARQTLQRMRHEWLADSVLDIGSAAMGARQNEIRDISCPGCGTTMDRVHDQKQPHIILDVCSACDGVFLDAGELTDMKTVTLMDHIHRLLSRFSK